MNLAGLLNPNVLVQAPTPPRGAVMRGTVADVTPLRLLVPSIDGGAQALRTFGTLPAGAAEGDAVRVMYDERDSLVLVAWEPA